MTILIPLALAFGALVFFGVNYLNSRRAYRSATKIQRWNAAIEDSREQESKGHANERLRHYLRMRGWNGSLFPLVVAVVFLYAICSLVL